MSSTPSHPERTRCRVGTSGYQYDHWRGLFYPSDLPKSQWLTYYSDHFDTVEINNTFYGLPAPSAFRRWKRLSPPGFCFALKFSRYGSHMKRLLDPKQTIGTFLDNARALEPRLGVILVQLKPKWPADPPRLKGFLEACPRNVRWAFEFRDTSWLCEPVFSLLRDFKAGLCLHDLIKDHPRVVTTDWVYMRYHGDRYHGSYSDPFLKDEARFIRNQLAHGRDVYAYFNNDADGFAPANALTLKGFIQSPLISAKPARPYAGRL